MTVPPISSVTAGISANSRKFIIFGVAILLVVIAFGMIRKGH